MVKSSELKELLNKIELCYMKANSETTKIFKNCKLRNESIFITSILDNNFKNNKIKYEIQFYSLILCYTLIIYKDNEIIYNIELTTIENIIKQYEKELNRTFKKYQ